MVARVVMDGASLGELLPAAQDKLAAREAAHLQELVFGATRWSGRLDCQLNLLLKKALRRKDSDVKVLLWLALYEIQYMRSPDYAVVNAYAALTSKLRKKWAKSFVNGVLREFLREQNDITAKVDQLDTGRSSLPDWILQQFNTDWPEHADSIVTAGNTKAPLVLRVNRSRGSRTEYQHTLQEAFADGDFSCRAAELGQDSLILDSQVKVKNLPGFDDGLCSVQDSAAQLAAELINPQAGQTILDACAAPGGKTCHLLELQSDCSVTAIDSSERRMERVKENLDRLKLSANCICADASDLDGWWDRQQYDAVLLDAPCSALGVLRRHPDIRLLRRATDIDSLRGQQKRLLASLWPTVKPGGKMVYVTCSVLKRENEQQMLDFLEANPDAVERGIEADWGQACKVGRQILPGQHEADGFYYAIIGKKSAAGVR